MPRWSTVLPTAFLVLVALLAIVLLLADRSSLNQAQRFRSEVATRLGRAPTPGLVGEADLAPLPMPVQRYLRYVGVVGRPRVQNFRVVFRGQLRSSLNAPWMASEVEQYSFLDRRERLFFLQARRFGVPFDALHMYLGPSATMRVKVASLATVVDAHGPEMDQSETVTMLNDLCLLAPAALVDLGDSVVWQTVDDREVRARFTNAGHTVNATLTFGEDGALRDFHSDDRLMTSDGRSYLRYRWSTPVTSYRSLAGVRLAAVVEAVWSLPTGPFPYARFDIAELQYNVGTDAELSVARAPEQGVR